MKSPRTIAYIGLVLAIGIASCAHGLWTWSSADPVKFISYLLLTVAASGMKIRLPSVLGTMSLSFLFILIGIAQFSLGETLLMGCAGGLVQCVFLAKHRPKGVQVAFNLASVCGAIELGYAVQHLPWLHSGVLTAAVYFVADTVPVAVIIGLTENKNAWNVWREAYMWTFPNYLVGAAAVWVVGETDQRLGWQPGLLLLPILYIIYRSHRSYVERLEEARKRAEQQAEHALEVAALHRRTIETLALAVEAKDQTTSDHLQRVETYAIGVAKELGMGGTDLEALRAAALLHDIGKLAVPEYIIAKPGKLTPEEFEKMKTHTVVGGEIVERIRFPYNVAPLVRGHHERWNGTGYPDGLAGEQIPLGARILAAVDCLDALSSDRQYRRAMPLSEAMDFVKSCAGTNFDPAVVEILARRHVELEALSKSEVRIISLPTAVRVERGDAPAAGFEKIAGAGISSPENATRDLSTLRRAVGRATVNMRALAGLTTRIAECDTPDNVFAALRESLGDIVQYAAMVVYVRRGDCLLPDCTDGDAAGLFGSREVPVGAGLSGWVAENGKAIVNGNPHVEPAYLVSPSEFSRLHAALAVPLVGPGGIAGVLSLYRNERDTFTNADLAAMGVLGAGIACVLEGTPPA